MNWHDATSAGLQAAGQEVGYGRWSCGISAIDIVCQDFTAIAHEARELSGCARRIKNSPPQQGRPALIRLGMYENSGD